MRSKMLGLAIALSTFGLGVAATTFWIARHTSYGNPLRIVDVPSVMSAPPEQLSPCADQLPVVHLPLKVGVLNGKATSKPAPVYPALARAAHVSGNVVVRVLVSKCGNVLFAKAISGNPLLQQSASDAAMNWHFSPTLDAGQPVDVLGTVTFNFLLQ